MLYLIPSALILTLIIAWATSMPAHVDTDMRAETIARNMQLEHAAAIGIAVENDVMSGTITDALRFPFRDMGGWTSRVVEDGTRRVVVTWSVRDPSFEASDRRRATGRIGATSTPDYPISDAGYYRHDASGGSVGRVAISNLDIPVADGTFVIATVIGAGG